MPLKRHALVVGVETYDDPRIAPLSFAAADAIELGRCLEDSLGFDSVVVLASDAPARRPTLVNIVNALQDATAELAPEDLFLFFFAGHGITHHDDTRLLVRDTPNAYPEMASLSLRWIRDALSHIRARQRLLLFDACRNAPEAGRGADHNLMGTHLARDIRAIAGHRPDPTATTAILTSCGPGQRAYEWPTKGHGVFTHYVLEAIQVGSHTNEDVTFHDIATYASERVRNWSERTPNLPTPQTPIFEQHGLPDPITLGRGHQERARQPPSESTGTDARRPPTTGAHQPPPPDLRPNDGHEATEERDAQRVHAAFAKRFGNTKGIRLDEVLQYLQRREQRTHVEGPVLHELLEATSLGELRVAVSPKAVTRLEVDRRTLSEAEGEHACVLPRGVHKVSVVPKSAGLRVRSRTVHVHPGATSRVRWRLTRAPQPRAWLAFGLQVTFGAVVALLLYLTLPETTMCMANPDPIGRIGCQVMLAVVTILIGVAVHFPLLAILSWLAHVLADGGSAVPSGTENASDPFFGALILAYIAVGTVVVAGGYPANVAFAVWALVFVIFVGVSTSLPSRATDRHGTRF